MAKQKHLERTMLKGILKNTATATVWTLAFLIEAGALTVQAFLAPSLYADFPDAGLMFSETPTRKNKKPKFKEITIRQSLRRLAKYGFVEKKNNSYVLTVKGREFAKYALSLKKMKMQTWDKKYRVVIFDIPEKKREVRTWLRQELYLLDYKKLQNSVFIGKYPLPQETIKKIKKEKISNSVNYLLVDKVYKNII